MFSKFNFLIAGLITGVYISQNYNIPEITYYITYVLDCVRKLEKESRKEF